MKLFIVAVLSFCFFSCKDHKADIVNEQQKIRTALDSLNAKQQKLIEAEAVADANLQIDNEVTKVVEEAKATIDETYRRPDARVTNPVASEFKIVLDSVRTAIEENQDKISVLKSRFDSLELELKKY